MNTDLLSRAATDGLSTVGWTTIGVHFFLFGLVVGWLFGTANQYDADFHSLIEEVADEIIVFADTSIQPLVPRLI